MINNNPSKLQFDKGLEGLRKVALTPEEKGVLFKSLLHYAETHEPAKQTLLGSLTQFFKGFLPVKIK